MTKKTPFHYGYVIVLCCFLIMFVVVGLVMSTAGIFYKPVSQDLGIEVGQFGIYMSLNFLFSTLMLSVAGRLMQRFSARWLLSLSSLLVAANFMFMSTYTALWQFYVSGAVFGILLVFLLYIGFPTMLNRWFKTRMGMFIGICSAGSGIGGIAFNPIAGYMIATYGWRHTYLFFGLIILVLVTPTLALLLRDFPEEKGLQPYGATDSATSAGVPTEQTGTDYASAIKMPVFYGLIGFAFLMNATATLNIFVPSFMQSAQFSVEQASYAASAVMLGVTVGKVGLGMINDRSPLFGVLTESVLGISGLLFLLLSTGQLWMALAGGFLFGWAYAGVTVQTPMLVRAVFGNRSYAEIYSNISMAISVGGAVAAGAWGLMADSFSFNFVFGTGIVFLMLSAFLGLVALKNRKTTISI